MRCTTVVATAATIRIVAAQGPAVAPSLTAIAEEHSGVVLWPLTGHQLGGRGQRDSRRLRVKASCGSRTRPHFPGQRPVPGARMALLSEVFDLVERCCCCRVDNLTCSTWVRALSRRGHAGSVAG